MWCSFCRHFSPLTVASRMGCDIHELEITMANLNLRYFYDHYCKSAHQISVAPVNPTSGIFSVVCDLASRSFLLVSCAPLFTIRRLPAAMDQMPVVRFYYQQWRDDLAYIESPHHRVGYSVARIPDALRLMGNYNLLTRAYKNRKACACQCKCECDGSCSNIII